MNVSLMSFAPALGLLALLVLLAWGVQWIKRRTTPQGSGAGAQVRLVSQLALGPQQRVAVVEVQGPQGTVQLTLGITPQHVRTLHTQALATPAAAPARPSAAPDAPSYREVAAALQDARPGAQP